MRAKFLLPRVTLIVAGILIGLAARAILGEPAGDDGPPRSIDRSLKQTSPDSEQIRLLDPTGKPIGVRHDSGSPDLSGVVPPILLPGQLPVSGTWKSTAAGDSFEHDTNAIFHSHGDQLCASGCAASRHPTEILTNDHYVELIDAYRQGPLDDSNHALETLLYFGPQTRAMMERQGFDSLPAGHGKFLWNQLNYTHAVVQLRLVDQQGQTRSWLDSSSVPFDRRHVFDMETENLQPLVTSGTVKRVGLNHLWVRL